MLSNIPNEVEDELFEHCKESYQRGLDTRRVGILYSAIILIVMLISLAFLRNVADGLIVAVSVSISSLCVVWAIYSVSASLNMQSDVITKLLIHYGEAHSDKESTEK